MRTFALEQLLTGSPATPSVQLSLASDLTYPLYRYTKRTHLEDFKATGRLRLGTLFEYRNVELYGAEVGDFLEGGRTVLQVGQPWIGISSLSSVNSWMLCMATRSGGDMYDKFAHADCSFRINSVDFFREISKALGSQARLGTVSPVDYVDDHEFHRRAQDWQMGLGAEPLQMFLKEPRYREQDEVRAVWEPHRPDLMAPRAHLRAIMAQKFARGGTREQFEAGQHRFMNADVSMPSLEATFVTSIAAAQHVDLHDER